MTEAETGYNLTISNVFRSIVFHKGFLIDSKKHKNISETSEVNLIYVEVLHSSRFLNKLKV